jgi:2-oxo-4-hydroxy-4-carboxy-5-ureidoimidazoline decarboxylase
MQIPEGAVDDRLEAVTDADLRACCAADSWVEAVTAARPYRSLDSLLAVSDAAVLALDATGLDQALAAHPRIGERRSGAGREETRSRREQGAALGAGADVAALLAAGNRDYEQRFGRVFLIRAAGRTAEQMYDELQARLGNDDDTERDVVLHELAEIVRLRLAGLVAG